MGTTTTTKNRLLLRVRHALARLGVSAQSAKIVVAVSGGPDSVALAHLLHALKNPLDIHLVLAHLNHGLRGQESDEDAEFVARLALELSLPLDSSKVDLIGIHEQQGGNLQDLARTHRYQFLLQAANRRDADWIAFGHNRDDQVETMLLSQIRGTGPAGLRGMPPRRSLAESVSLIRPILKISRKDLLAFLEEENIAFRHDSSNEKIHYRRNRLRKELLPQLREINPRFDKNLTRLGRVIAAEDDYLKQVADATILKLEESRMENHNLPGWDLFWDCRAEEFCKLNPALIRRILYRLLPRYLPRRHPPLARHIDRLVSLVSGGSPQWNLKIGGEIYFCRRYEILFIGHERTGGEEASILLPEQGKVSVPALNGTICIERIDKPADTKPLFQSKSVKKGLCVYFDAAKIDSPLLLRRRQPGDRLPPLGLKGTKKIKKLMMESELTREQRRQPRVLTCGNEILWIIGSAMNENFRITDTTGEMLRVEFVQEETAG